MTHSPKTIPPHVLDTALEAAVLRLVDHLQAMELVHAESHACVRRAKTTANRQRLADASAAIVTMEAYLDETVAAFDAWKRDLCTKRQKDIVVAAVARVRAGSAHTH